MAKTKVKVGVVFAAKELEVEVEGATPEVLERIQGAIAGGEKVIAVTNDKGKTVVIPIDKLAYVEVEDAEKAGGIGFGR